MLYLYAKKSLLQYIRSLVQESTPQKSRTIHPYVRVSHQSSGVPYHDDGDDSHAEHDG